MLSARDGPGGLLSSFLELLAVLVHASQQAPNRLWQVGCTIPDRKGISRVASERLWRGTQLP